MDFISWPGDWCDGFWVSERGITVTLWGTIYGAYVYVYYFWDLSFKEDVFFSTKPIQLLLVLSSFFGSDNFNLNSLLDCH